LQADPPNSGTPPPRTASATAYEHGDGVPLDLRAAYDCYRRAEKLGVTTARYAADAIGRMLDPAVRREVERVLGTR
jgi:TPR repeat protein